MKSFRVYGEKFNAQWELDDNSAAAHEFSIRKKIVLVIFVMAFVIMIIGVMNLGWWFPQMAAECVTLSILVMFIGGPMFVICLLLIFFVLGFVVPSSSGLAVLSMPIFAPLADTVGIPRWIIVAAYQFGQYAMLYIAPTGLVMATLQMLDMKMSHWFKFVWPMMVFTLVFGAILLSVCSVVFAV